MNKTQEPKMTKDEFISLLLLDKDIINNYDVLKERIDNLKITISKIKRLKEDLKVELNANVDLVDLAVKDTNRGIKKFKRDLSKFIIELLNKRIDIPDDVKNLLNDASRLLNLEDTSHDEVIRELIRNLRRSRWFK